MKNNSKTLSDVTREASTTKVNRFANSLMPVAPKPRTEAHKETPDEVVDQTPVNVDPHAPVVSLPPVAEVVLTPVAPKPERTRKSSNLSVEEVVNTPGREGDVFNKMVRVTDDHHELLRLMAFKYRKPMNIIVHNLIALLDQAYQKEQKGDTSNV